MKELIEKIENPCTDEYEKLKEFVLGETMPWNFYETTYSSKIEKEIPLYSHVVMQRPLPPEIPYSIIKSDLFLKVDEVLRQIFSYNKMRVYVIYRINFNILHSKLFNYE